MIFTCISPFRFTSSFRSIHTKCPMATTKKRSVCPVACSLDILGDKWTLLLIRDLYCGKSRYSEFLRSPEHIATNILADRLERLIEHRIIEASPSPQRTGSDSYHLTPRGQALLPVLEALKNWGLSHVKGTAALLQPAKQP